MKMLYFNPLLETKSLKLLRNIKYFLINSKTLFNSSLVIKIRKPFASWSKLHCRNIKANRLFFPHWEKINLLIIKYLLILNDLFFLFSIINNMKDFISITELHLKINTVIILNVHHLINFVMFQKLEDMLPLKQDWVCRSRICLFQKSVNWQYYLKSGGKKIFKRS